jgi:hypothetical protein
LAAASLLTLCAPVRAEDPELARSLNQKAIEAFKAEKFLDAIDFWLQATDVASEVQLVKIHKNLGLALKGVERLPEAWYHLTVYLQRADTTDVDVAQTIRDMEDSLKKVHIKVRVETEPQGATVVFPPGDRMHRIKTPLSWWLPPGEYTLELLKDGHVSMKETIRVGVGEKDSYRFELAVVPTTGALVVMGHQEGSSVRIDGKSMGPLPVTVDLSPGDHRVEVFWEGQGSWTGGAKVVAGQRTDVVAQVPEGRVGQGEGGAVNGSGSGGTGGQGNGARNGKPWWPWLLVGVGGAAAAGGGAAFYVAYERNKNLDGATQTEIDEKFNSEVVPPAYTAYALWGVGGALVAGGVAALLLTGDSGGSERGTVSFFPDLSPDHVGATVGIFF